MILRFAVLALVLWGSASAGPLPAPVINDRYRITFSPARTALTLAYVREHYDPAARSIGITPVMVVIHWTAYSTLQSTLAAFQGDVLMGREDIRSGGALNVGAHYLVDRDGRIYRLIDDSLLARHTIGLNRVAIGIENVGLNDLTAAQLRADTRLVEWLAGRFGLKYLIGHFEYGAFRGSLLWEERQAGYFTVKSDPGAAFMAALRAALAADGVRLKAAP